MNYDASNWYWIVAGDASRLYSSQNAAYVPATDAIYQVWLAAGNKPTRIISEAELWDVLARQYPAGIAGDNTVGQDALHNFEFDRVDKIVLKIAFNHENRIRALEGQQPITTQQFKDAIKAL